MSFNCNLKIKIERQIRAQQLWHGAKSRRAEERNCGRPAFVG